MISVIISFLATEQFLLPSSFAQLNMLDGSTDGQNLTQPKVRFESTPTIIESVPEKGRQRIFSREELSPLIHVSSKPNSKPKRQRLFSREELSPVVPVASKKAPTMDYFRKVDSHPLDGMSEDLSQHSDEIVGRVRSRALSRTEQLRLDTRMLVFVLCVENGKDTIMRLLTNYSEAQLAVDWVASWPEDLENQEKSVRVQHVISIMKMIDTLKDDHEEAYDFLLAKKVWDEISNSRGLKVDALNDYDQDGSSLDITAELDADMSHVAFELGAKYIMAATKNFEMEMEMGLSGMIGFTQEQADILEKENLMKLGAELEAKASVRVAVKQVNLSVEAKAFAAMTVKASKTFFRLEATAQAEVAWTAELGSETTRVKIGAGIIGAGFMNVFAIGHTHSEGYQLTAIFISCGFDARFGGRKMRAGLAIEGLIVNFEIISYRNAKQWLTLRNEQVYKREGDRLVPEPRVKISGNRLVYITPEMNLFVGNQICFKLSSEFGPGLRFGRKFTLRSYEAPSRRYICGSHIEEQIARIFDAQLRELSKAAQKGRDVTDALRTLRDERLNFYLPAEIDHQMTQVIKNQQVPGFKQLATYFNDITSFLHGCDQVVEHMDSFNALYKNTGGEVIELQTKKQKFGRNRSKAVHTYEYQL
jgi:hypothetical protein